MLNKLKKVSFNKCSHCNSLQIIFWKITENQFLNITFKTKWFYCKTCNKYFSKIQKGDINGTKRLVA